MSKEYILHTNPGMVYVVGKKDNIILKSNEKMAFSKDQQYILVYTEKDRENMLDIYEYFTYTDYIAKRSLMDKVLDHYLEEFNIEKNHYGEYQMITKKLNDDEITLRFEMDDLPAQCITNKKDAASFGSKVVYVVSSKDDVGITCAINTIDKEVGEQR